MRKHDKRLCDHGLTDDTELVSKTTCEDYIHGTRSLIYGFWCNTHQKFGQFSNTETIPATKAYIMQTDPA